MNTRKFVSIVLAFATVTLSGRAEPQPSAAAATAVATHAVVAHNDNRAPAGVLNAGVLTIALRAAPGLWQPSGPGAAIAIEAFAEGAGPPTVPAPLIRVPEDTTIAATVRNDLPHPLRVHGLCQRGGEACAPLDVPAGATAQRRFSSGRAGTYHYWATTTGMPQQFRAVDDSQLSGAFIVDPPDADPAVDRVFVITEWSSLTRDQLQHVLRQDDPGAAFLKIRPDMLFLINGRSWPHTERLRYELGAPVRWRVINLSTQSHPMHLHGFYFDVDSIGDGMRDQRLPAAQRPHVVTQLMPPGSTLAMTWTPEREGNWLFHCHVMTHVSPVLHVDGSAKPHAERAGDHHAAAGMTGMVLGITVHRTGAAKARPDASPARAPRQLTLLMRSEPQGLGDAPAFGFALQDGGDITTARVSIPGPTLVLTRGEPVAITLVNRLPGATAIHWHGMELDSYYDGVHGWGGKGERVTPMVAPGESFVVRFTPPRTGTFMYHTHLHDRKQLTSGLYGAMLVVEPGTTFDEATDHVIVLGRGGPARGAPVVINNEREPAMVWKAGTRHRLRLINITPDDVLAVSLQTAEGPAAWRPLTKDGAPVAADRAVTGPSRQTIGVGEIYDFEYEPPPGRGGLWLEVRSPGGKWQSQGRVIIR
jgi:FtsP/CotA-like multicopper oxidase with cupredoxin domain